MKKKVKNYKYLTMPNFLGKAVGAVLIFIIGLLVGLMIEGNSLVISKIENLPFTELKNLSEKNYPKSTISVEHSCYNLSYDCRTRNAAWVYERLTANNIEGKADRANSQFKVDPSIPEIFRSTLNDYRKSGFDRGHLAPAANHKNSPESMSDTFYLSNMSPQVSGFNRGYWSKLEKHVRDLTKAYDVVEVFTGPLYLPYNEVDGTKWIKYRVIGKNDVAVPTHFFKVMCLHAQDRKELVAYILPNNEIQSKTPLEQFKTTVGKVEKASGIIFHFNN